MRLSGWDRWGAVRWVHVLQVGRDHLAPVHGHPRCQREVERRRRRVEGPGDHWHPGVQEEVRAVRHQGPECRRRAGQGDRRADVRMRVSLEPSEEGDRGKRREEWVGALWAVVHVQGPPLGPERDLSYRFSFR